MLNGLLPVALSEVFLVLNLLVAIVALEVDEQADEARDPFVRASFERASRICRVASIMLALAAIAAMRQAT